MLNALKSTITSIDPSALLKASSERLKAFFGNVPSVGSTPTGDVAAAFVPDGFQPLPWAPASTGTERPVTRAATEYAIKVSTPNHDGFQPLPWAPASTGTERPFTRAAADSAIKVSAPNTESIQNDRGAFDGAKSSGSKPNASERSNVVYNAPVFTGETTNFGNVSYNTSVSAPAATGTRVRTGSNPSDFAGAPETTHNQPINRGTFTNHGTATINGASVASGGHGGNPASGSASSAPRPTAHRRPKGPGMG